MLYGKGKYNEAKAYIEKSISLANFIYGKDTPAALINNIGMGLFYDNIGEYKKAFEIYFHIKEKLSVFLKRITIFLLLCIIVSEIFIWDKIIL